MPRPSIGLKIVWVVQFFGARPKIDVHFVPFPNIMWSNQMMISIQEIWFLCTKFFEEALYAITVFGLAQNIFGPVEEQGLSYQYFFS